MATIEINTSKSIINNKHLLKMIVPNRIWDEFFKAFHQVKDFSVYLNYLDQYDLWQYVFPGMKINHNIVKCSSLELYIANLFKDEEVTDFVRFQNKIVQTCFIPRDISHVVTFLIWFQSFNIDELGKFYSKRNGYKDSNNPITDECLYEWIKIAGLSDKMFTAFVKYKQITSSEELMKKGFFKNALGAEIKRLEIENFKKLI